MSDIVKGVMKYGIIGVLAYVVQMFGGTILTGILGGFVIVGLVIVAGLAADMIGLSK